MRCTPIWMLAAVLALGLPGCSKFRKAPQPPPAPAPVQPKLEPPVTPQPQVKPMEEPPLPATPQPAPDIEPQVIRPKLGQVEPPKPTPPARRRPKPTRSAAVNPKPVKPADPAINNSAPVAQTPAQTPAQPAVQPPAQTTPDPAPANPAPQIAKPEIKLAEVLTEEQRRDYNQTIDDSVGEARRALVSLQGRTLTREQTENESRVRTFIRQAEETRASDVRAAAQFSRRAALLARELLETLK